MKKSISQLIADFKKDCLELGFETEIVFKSVSEMISSAGRCETAKHLAIRLDSLKSVIRNGRKKLRLYDIPFDAEYFERCKNEIPLSVFQNELFQQSVSLASAKPHSDNQSEAVKYLNANISKYESVRIKPFIDGSVFVETFDLQLQLKYDQLMREYKFETASLRETIENQSKLINQ